MNLAFLITKIAVVAFFLFMFLRSNKLSWGIGLLAVTTAILLDTFLGTFGLEEMLQQFGFFFYVIVGALFAGGALWLWGLLSPYARSSEPGLAPDDEPDQFREDQALQELPAGSVAFDQMSTDQRVEPNGPEIADQQFQAGVGSQPVGRELDPKIACSQTNV